jgi:hypothetical protein
MKQGSCSFWQRRWHRGDKDSGSIILQAFARTAPERALENSRNSWLPLFSHWQGKGWGWKLTFWEPIAILVLARGMH